MKPKGIHLVWIVVKDFKSAVKFYTEVIGLEIRSITEEYGWAELVGKDGMALGIAQDDGKQTVRAGQNGVFTLTVDDLEKSKKEMQAKGAKMIDDIVEVPGHVKLQLGVDRDGNHFQLVQELG